MKTGKDVEHDFHVWAKRNNRHFETMPTYERTMLQSEYVFEMIAGLQHRVRVLENQIRAKP